MSDASEMKRLAAKAFFAATVGIAIFGGCSSLRSSRFALPEKKQSAAPVQSSISQLGAALPAMKPGDDRELCLIAADQMSEKGHWEDAVELYRKAEKLDPKKRLLDAKLAPALAGAGQYAESIERYRRLVVDAPKDAELRNNFAWTLMEAGDFSSAESEFRQAIVLAPQQTKASLNLGVMLAKQRRYDESLALLTPAIGEASAHHNIGVIAIDIGDEATAIRAFERASSLPGAPNASAEFLASLRPQISQSKFK